MGVKGLEFELDRFPDAFYSVLLSFFLVPPFEPESSDASQSWSNDLVFTSSPLRFYLVASPPSRA